MPFFADADTLLSGSGWTGAGLLGSVLAWLLFRHLPAKDEQVKGMIERYDAAMDRLIDRHEKSLTEARTEFRESLEAVVTHCEREMEKHATGMQALSTAVDKLTQAVSVWRGLPG